MKCDEIEQYIDAYLDRELPDTTRTELETHLRDCEACRKEYGRWVKLFQPCQPVAVPDAVYRRIHAAVCGREQKSRVWRVWMTRFVAAAAVVMLIVMGMRWLPKEKPVKSEPIAKNPAEMPAVPNPWLAVSSIQSLVSSGGWNPAGVCVQAVMMDQLSRQLAERTSSSVPLRYRVRVQDSRMRIPPVSGVDIATFSLFSRF